MSTDLDEAASVVVDRLAAVMHTANLDEALRSAMAQLLGGIRAWFATTDPKNLYTVMLPLAFAPTPRLEVEDDLTGVAAAATAVYMGGRLLDDVIDGHDISYFDADQASTDVLGWVTLLAVVPPLLLTDLQLEPVSRLRVVHEFSHGTAAMASGQLRDAGVSPDGLPTPAAAFATVQGKTGALLATIMRACARVAGFDDAASQDAWRFGMELGVARQLVLDTTKLRVATERRTDRQSPSLFVAEHGAMLDDDARQTFVELVARARTDTDARHKVNAQVSRSPVVRAVMMRAEVALGGAEAALAALPVTAETRGQLQAMIDQASPLATSQLTTPSHRRHMHREA